MPERPDFIAHWTGLEDAEAVHYRGDEERMAFDASVGEKLGATRIGIHHVRVPPGRRTSYPHAESAEEEFVFVIEGRPDAWIEGVLHSLSPGDSVAFPAGTGICHTFLNNTAEEVRLLVVGEKPKSENRIRYPLNQAYELTREDRWPDAPPRPMGPHDGRARVGGGGKPSCAPRRDSDHGVLSEKVASSLSDASDQAPGRVRAADGFRDGPGRPATA
jgi:uncharacterized cupin superfamily protein